MGQLKSQRDFGFSLLEVLLVLILIAGAGFFLLVKLPVQIENRNLSIASTQLVQEIRDARNTALAENVWYEIRFYASNNNYKILKEGNTLIKSINLPPKISFSNQPSTIRFTASGMTYFTGSSTVSGLITISNGKNSRNIITALITGRVREEIK